MMQFSLRTMMLAMFIIAVFCAVVFSFPSWLSGILVGALVCLLPALLVTTIIYGDSEPRAFAIGASATYVVALLFFPRLLNFRFGGGFLNAVAVLLYPFLLVASGWGSVLWRRWLLRHAAAANSPIPPPRASSRSSPPDAPDT